MHVYLFMEFKIQRNGHLWAKSLNCSKKKKVGDVFWDSLYLTIFNVFSLSVCADLVRDLHQLNVDTGPTDDANQIQVGKKIKKY